MNKKSETLHTHVLKKLLFFALLFKKLLCLKKKNCWRISVENNIKTLQKQWVFLAETQNALIIDTWTHFLNIHAFKQLLEFNYSRSNYFTFCHMQLFLSNHSVLYQPVIFLSFYANQNSAQSPFIYI